MASNIDYSSLVPPPVAKPEPVVDTGAQPHSEPEHSTEEAAPSSGRRIDFSSLLPKQAPASSEASSGGKIDFSSLIAKPSVTQPAPDFTDQLASGDISGALSTAKTGLEQSRDFHIGSPEITATPTFTSKLAEGDISGALGISKESVQRALSPLLGPTEAQKTEQSVQSGRGYEFRPAGNEIEKRGLVPAVIAAGSASLDLPSLLGLNSRGVGNTLTEIDHERLRQSLKSNPNDNAAVGTGKAVYNSILNLSHSVGNPLFMRAIDSRLISGAFSIDMLSGVKGQVEQALSSPTLQGKIEGVLGALSGLVFGGLSGYHTLKPSASPAVENMRSAAANARSVAPATAAAVEAQAKLLEQLQADQRRAVAKAYEAPPATARSEPEPPPPATASSAAAETSTATPAPSREPAPTAAEPEASGGEEAEGQTSPKAESKPAAVQPEKTQTRTAFDEGLDEIEKLLAEEPKSAAAPAFVSRAMEQQLADLGYSKTERNKLTPVEAQKIIETGVSKPKPQTQNATPEKEAQESVRQEPENRTQVGKAEEAGAGDSLQRAEAGEKVAEPLDEPAPPAITTDERTEQTGAESTQGTGKTAGTPETLPDEESARREKAVVDAYDIANGIGQHVAAGQPDTVVERAVIAAFDNARSSIEKTGQFNPKFMRRAAMRAAGREAGKATESLNEPVHEEESHAEERIDQLASHQPQPDETAQTTEEIETADLLLRGLNERERRIVQGHTMHGESFQEIAEELGITKQRVQQIHEQAVEKLRKRYVESRAGTTEARGAPMAEEAIRNRLATEHGLNPDKITFTNDPESSRQAALHVYPDGSRRLEINVAKIDSPARLDAVVREELAHAFAEDQGGVNRKFVESLVEKLTTEERKEIDSDIERAGYLPTEVPFEQQAKGLQRLADQWRDRPFFEQAVGHVMAWASKVGLPMTRLAAERLAAKSIADAVHILNAAKVGSGTPGQTREAKEFDKAEFIKTIGREAAVAGLRAAKEARQSGASEEKAAQAGVSAIRELVPNVSAEQVREFFPKPAEPEPEESASGESGTLGSTGISQRLHEQRVPGEIVPGKGSSTEALIQRGRELFQGGADPEEIIASIKKGKAITGEEMAILRAKTEELSKATDKTGDALRKNPNDPTLKQAAEDALKAETDFRKRIKPAATEASEVFRALQGETDIDTGSFTGLRRSFIERNNRYMTPAEQARAKQLVDDIAKKDGQISDLQAKLDEFISGNGHADVSEIMNRVLEDIKAARKSKGAGQTLIDFAKQMREDALKELRSRGASGAGGTAFSLLDPRDLYQQSRIGASLIIEGVGNLAKFTSQMVDLLGEQFRPVIEEHAQEIYDASRQQAEILKTTHTSARKGGQTRQEIDKEKRLLDGYQKKIEDLRERTASGDFSKRVRKPKAIGSAAEQKAADELKSEREKFASARDAAAGKVPKDADGLRDYFEKQRTDGTFTGKFSPAEVAAIWEHAKAFIDTGNRNFSDMATVVAQQLGIRAEEVKTALTQNKATRAITNEMYRKMYDRRQMVNAAKDWVEKSNQPGYAKAIRAITNYPRAIAVLGHANAMLTHAGQNAFRPAAWASWGKNMVRNYKFLGSKAAHESAMQDLTNHPDYELALRSGLRVAPGTIEDYAAYGKFLGVVGEAGNRAMDSLKTFRMDYFSRELKRFDPAIQKEVAPLLANWVNHISGFADIGFGKHADIMREMMFAPSLEASRWANVVGDPVKVMDTFRRWSTATPAEKAMAKFYVNRQAQLASAYVAALMANYGLQAATGQQDGVNFTDPTKSDWMKFKWNGHTYDPTGGLSGPLRLLANLFQDLNPYHKNFRGRSGLEAVTSDLAFYLRGKLDPKYGIAADVLDRQNIIGRPMPFSDKEGTARHPKFTWFEYTLEHAPIPVAEAAREAYSSMRDNGMNEDTAQMIVGSLIAFAIGAFGIKEGVTPAPTTGDRVSSARPVR